MDASEASTIEKNINYFCKKLPKVELHAHLNGSLSEKTIQALSHLEGAPHLYENWQLAIQHEENRTLSECFDMFKAVHALSTSPVAVFRSTSDVLLEFEEDGVLYLELRSTPREVPGRMSKAEYIESIISAILAHPGKMMVKLLLSIDRRQGAEEAEHTLRLAIESRAKHPNVVVGLDLSGDPTVGTLSLFLPTMKAAREAGLGVVIHCAEVPNEQEISDILDFGPNRLGHATCIHPELGGNKKLWEKLLKSGIPVEVCLTSNVRCKTVQSYKTHHLKYLLEAKHPIVISVSNGSKHDLLAGFSVDERRANQHTITYDGRYQFLPLHTDDKGVFCSDLSQEYCIAATTFGLTQERLKELSCSSLDLCILNEEEKTELRKMFHSTMEQLNEL